MVLLVHSVDDDIRIFDQLPRAFDKSGAAHMRQIRRFQSRDFLLDSTNQPSGGCRFVFIYPIENIIELVSRGGLKGNFHGLVERKRWNTCSAGILFSLGLASRRRTSAACSLVS
jgi:hypothetical protein